MKRSVLGLGVLGLLAIPSVVLAQTPPNRHAGFDPPTVAPRVVRGSAAKRQAALVATMDPWRGVPSFVWGAADAASPLPFGAPPSEIAREHLAAHAELYGLSAAALATAEVRHVHDLGRGGIVVTLRQRVSGVEVFHDDAKVLLRQDGSLVAIGGHLHPDAVPATKLRAFALSRADAVAGALKDLYGIEIDGSALVEQPHGTDERFRRFSLASPASGAVSGLRFERPARARPVLFPMPDRLVPAFYVELFAQTQQGSQADMFGYVVSARDGSILYRRNMTSDATFSYRVWAEPAGDKRPLDGPVADFTPHPTGVPDGSYPPYVLPDLVAIDGFNGPADPWLPAGATETTGNNVDAYTDHDNPGGFSAGDLRATVTSPGVFDRVYDTTLHPLASPEQSMAAVTELFYVVNWMHDYWYDSGFDEPSGNAQVDNYGRGGEQGDPILAEAQDKALLGASNNANMATPEDGESPRMQMYLWDNVEQRDLTVMPGGQMNTGTAEFGPQSYDVTAAVTLANDGTGTATDACEALQGFAPGTIALVDRGTCSFHLKALNAQAAGAAGVILANNQAGGPPNMPGSNLGPVSIPMMSVSQTNGNAIKASLGGGPVTATMFRNAGPILDSTLDNLIVAHEWGHYIHHRLVFCAMTQCAGQSEGWGDFLALTLQLRPSDDLSGAFSDAVYSTAAYPDAAYFGLRRMPYSVDTTKNALSFRHISNGEALPNNVPIDPSGAPNAEVHNTGEIWATMMFEGYVSLLQQSKGPAPKYDFAEGRRRMADYVVAGMKLAPAEPTFVEQRDGVLAAAFAADPDDALLMAQGFAKRGAGSCAVAPPKDTQTNVGVVESFDLAPELALPAMTLDDSIKPCDTDGVLDAGETGELVVDVSNRGLADAAGTTVTVSSPTAGVTFPLGDTFDVVALSPFAVEKVTFAVALDEGATFPDGVEIHVTAEHPTACQQMVELVQLFPVDYDDSPMSSATDSFESTTDVWTREGDQADVIWALEQTAGLEHAWHGVDYSAISDTALVSPPMLVAPAGNLVMSFSHRHNFEASLENPNDPGSPYQLWDGGVIEVSTDGTNWTDVSQFGDPGYGGQIGNLADNPLADRQAYVDSNASWPARDDVTIDLGQSFAGQTIQVRFRIGTDQAAGDFGWEIDDVSFQGLAGTPFPSVVADGATCMFAPPVADAGPDQTVAPQDDVTLDASGSSDPDGDALTFEWSQVAGPSVTLAQNGAGATFVAPTVNDGTVLTFEVKVTTIDGEDTDTVDIVVDSMGGPSSSSSSSTGAGGGGEGGSGEGASGGEGADPKDQRPLVPEDTGCGCRTEPRTGGQGSLLAGLGLSILALFRRHRRNVAVRRAR